MTSPDPLSRYPTTPAYGAPVNRSRPGGDVSRDETTGPVRTPGSWTAVGLSVVLNLVTLLGVLAFGWPPGNVLLLFWLENAVLGVCTLVKVASAQAPSASGIQVNGRDAGSSPSLYAVFFTFHYGIFCVVHLVFTLIVAIKIGVEPTFFLLGLPLILIVIRYTIETWTTWFGPGELRRHTSAQQAMVQPYPRIIVLHVSILLAFAVVITDLSQDEQLAALRERAEPTLRMLPAPWQTQGVAVVAVLVVIKTVVDVFTTRRALRAR